MTRHFYKVAISHTSVTNTDGFELRQKDLERDVYVSQDQFEEIKKILDTSKNKAYESGKCDS